jgi:hypothetical protein
MQPSTTGESNSALAGNNEKITNAKLKLLIGNLRNPDAKNRGPRYLNTIESEGNLPTYGANGRSGVINNSNV